MSPSLRFSVFVIAGLLLAPGFAAAVQPPQASRARAAYVPDEVLVKYRKDIGHWAIEDNILKLGAQRVDDRAPFGILRLKLAPGMQVRDALARLRASGLVEYAEPNWYRYPREACSAIAIDHICPNDPEFDRQYGLHNTQVTGPVGFRVDVDADMDMPEAWSIQTAASDILTAIIDDGFDFDHADLDGNLTSSGFNCTANGCTTGAARQSSQDTHGTSVAGAFGAEGNNAFGVAGVVWNANILPIRIDFTTAAIINAIDKAVQEGARLINLSLGGPVFSQAERDALLAARNAGTLVIAAAGNEDSNTDKAVAAYPANYEVDNVLAVAATNGEDAIAYFSTWGSTSVDLGAPGQSIFTTTVGGVGAVSGTSFSAPYTTGVAALIAQTLCETRTGGPANVGSGNCTAANIPDYTDVKAYLFAGADPLNSNVTEEDFRGRVAAGRVNAYNSLALARDDSLSGAVIVARAITAENDTGDGDNLPDPGETFDLVVRLENVHEAAAAVTATLSTESNRATVNTAQQALGPVAAHDPTGNTDEVTARFPVTLSSFTGNEQILFKLELDVNGDTVTDQTRHFYFEVGSLTDGSELSQVFQRTDWDEFHAFHINVPSGAQNLVIETHTDNDLDIDLIARRGTPPEYMITLNADPEGGDAIFYAGEEESNPASVSGRFDGEEVLVFTNPSAEPYHLVTVNYAQATHTYGVKATIDATQHRFQQGNGQLNFHNQLEVSASEGSSLTLTVEREGPIDRATTVEYTTVAETATAGSDFTTVSGTLSWAAGETGAKTIQIPIATDSANDGGEQFRVVLRNPSGHVKATRGLPFDTLVTINNVSAGGGGGGGGGGAAGWLLLGALGMLAALRRRT